VVVVVTLLGFDLEHVFATLMKLRPQRTVRGIYAVTAVIGGTIDRRAVTAYSALALLANMLGGVRVEKVEVEVTDLRGAVQRVKGLLAELLAREDAVILDVGGGPRLLVLEALLAYLSLDRRLAERVKLVAYLERTGELVEIGYEEVAALLSERLRPLGKLEKQLLELLAPGREYTLRELHGMLLERGIRVSKQYVEKALKSLVERGLVCRRARGVYVKALELPT